MKTFEEKMHPKQKLYVVTCRDLPPGAQAVQLGHAVVSYIWEYPVTWEAWHEESNHLCYLSVENEEALETLCIEAKHREIWFARFYEPDLDNRLTAVCFEPTFKTAQLMSGLPLALREATCG